MKRAVCPFREKPVGCKRLKNVRRLCGNNDVAEALVFEQFQVAERRAYKRLGNVDFARVKFFAEWLLERAEVYANADRNLFLLCRAGDCLNPVARTDVAGIEAKRVRSRLNCSKRA